MVPRKDKKKTVLYCAKCGYTAPFRNTKAERVIPVRKSVDVVVDDSADEEGVDKEQKEAFLESYDLEEEEESSDD
ncbi:MAG: hypothetical protein M1357_00580 [Candidatus Marsarchaeota archaeon]|nr:hypothetical protein [Candidatus Marsarchaeota archaeon]